MSGKLSRGAIHVPSEDSARVSCCAHVSGLRAATRESAMWAGLAGLPHGSRGGGGHSRWAAQSRGRSLCGLLSDEAAKACSVQTPTTSWSSARHSVGMPATTPTDSR